MYKREFETEILKVAIKRVVFFNDGKGSQHKSKRSALKTFPKEVKQDRKDGKKGNLQRK